MLQIMLILPLVGLLALGVGEIWLMVIAFKESLRRGLMYIVVPFYSLYYGRTRWPKTRMPFFTLLIGFGIVAISIFVIIPYGFSHLLTHARSRPMEPEITTSSVDAGLSLKEAVFTSPDGVQLSGWFLPRENAPATIIYCHGLFRSRMEMLDRATRFWQDGYAGLLFDFRRHGKSGGELSSMGYLERLDVIGAVHYVVDSLQIKGPVVVHGVSMGAAAALLAAAEDSSIAGLIVDSSFLSFDHTIAHHAKTWLGLPKFPIVDELIFFTKSRVGFDSEDFDLRRAVQKIDDRPILFIAGGADTRMPPQIAQTLYEASPGTRKKLVIVPKASHGAAYRTDPVMYEKAVLECLEMVCANK
jgi:fermentation-respiration switch protein FrsA (DUF1100 family)